MRSFFRAVWPVVAFVLAGPARAPAAPEPLVTLPIRDKPLSKGLEDTEWVGFSPNGEWLAVRFRVSDRAARVRAWKFGDWKASDAEFDDRGSGLLLPACAFHPDKPLLYAAGDGVLHAYGLPLKGRPESSQIRKKDASSEREEQSADVAADGKSLRVTTASYAYPGVRVDRVPLEDRGAVTTYFEARSGKVDCRPALSPDGALVAIGTQIGRDLDSKYAVEVWSVAPAKRLWSNAELGFFVRGLRFSPDGRTLAVGDGSGSLSVFDATTGKRTELAAEPHTVSALDFHPNRRLLAFGTFQGKGETNLRLLDLESGKAVGSVRADQFGVHDIRFSRDGKWLATAGGDGSVRVWAVDLLLNK